MILKVANIKIPDVWDKIKFSLSQVEGLTDKISAERYNYILASLLTDKSQCFLRVSGRDGVTIKALMVTEIHKDPVFNINILKIICLYAFGVNNKEDWGTDYGFLLDFAKSVNCTEILFESSNPRVIELARSVGFVEKFTTFGYKLEI
jgi:hypothetical protein